MPYTAEQPPRRESREQLQARIPGWGADLDPRDRPAVPRLQFDPAMSGAHWDFPERQPETRPRERSIEHAFLTPVFGTTCPPKGASGVIRRFAYQRYSEARAAHWLLLLAADRVDALESHLASLLTRHPDNLLAETGIVSERAGHGIRSRLGQGRTDVKHQVLDPVVVAAPWLISGGLGVVALRKIGNVVRSVRS